MNNLLKFGLKDEVPVNSTELELLKECDTRIEVGKTLNLQCIRKQQQENHFYFSDEGYKLILENAETIDGGVKGRPAIVIGEKTFMLKGTFWKRALDGMCKHFGYTAGKILAWDKTEEKAWSSVDAIRVFNINDLKCRNHFFEMFSEVIGYQPSFVTYIGEQKALYRLSTVCKRKYPLYQTRSIECTNYPLQ